MEIIRQLLITPAFWVGVISVLSTLIVCLITISNTRRNHKELMISKQREERRKEIYKQLNDFYGPFQLYLNTSKELFNVLSNNKPENFRTLTYLINRNQEYMVNGNKVTIQLDNTEEIILDQIVQMGDNMSVLIIEKAGLIDNVKLRYNYTSNPQYTDVEISKNGLLAFANAHFLFMKLARLEKLGNNASKFSTYVFPRELPDVIETEIQKLKKELEELNMIGDGKKI